MQYKIVSIQQNSASANRLTHHSLRKFEDFHPVNAYVVVAGWRNGDALSVRPSPINNSSSSSNITWWRHQMETFSALLAFCEGKSTGGFPSQKPVAQIFDVFFDLRLNKRFKQTIETPVILDAIALIMTSHFRRLRFTVITVLATYQIFKSHIFPVKHVGKLFPETFASDWYLTSTWLALNNPFRCQVHAVNTCIRCVELHIQSLYQHTLQFTHCSIFTKRKISHGQFCYYMLICEICWLDKLKLTCIVSYSGIVTRCSH